MRRRPSRTAIAATVAVAALTAGAFAVATGGVADGDASLTSGAATLPQHLHTMAWRISYPLGGNRPHVPSGAGESDLQDTLAVGPRSVWAVGSVQDGAADLRHAVALHWDGGKWTGIPLPAPFQRPGSPVDSSGLSLIRAAGGSVWAFGWAKGGRARYALSWNGAFWTVSHEWDAYGDFTDAVVTGPANVWAFDDRPGPKAQVGTWHFDGLTWTRSNTPFHLIAAKALSRGDIWGTALVPANNGLFRPTVTHWDGWQWRALPTPALRSTPDVQAVLTAITAGSGSDVWAVGYEAHGRQLAPVALHWDGAKWRRADPHGSGYGLYSVTQDGRGGVWAAEGDTYRGGAIHFTGGRWTSAALPRVPGRSVAVRTVSRVPGGSGIWAAGVLVWGSAPHTVGVVLTYS